MKLNELNKAIDDLNSSASKLGERYQEVGLLCLAHVVAHGDVGPCNRLYLGMPKSSRGLAMGQWLVKYGPLKINGDRGTQATMPMVFDKSKAADIEGATATKWWTTAPERSITDTFDLQVAIQRLLQQCKGKKIKIGGIEKPHEAEQALRTMSALVGLKVEPMHVGKDGKMTDEPVEDEAGTPATTADPAVAKVVEQAVQAAVVPAVKAAAKETAQAKAKGDKPTGRTAAKSGKARANA